MDKRKQLEQKVNDAKQRYERYCAETRATEEEYSSYLACPNGCSDQDYCDCQMEDPPAKLEACFFADQQQRMILLTQLRVLETQLSEL